MLREGAAPEMGSVESMNSPREQEFVQGVGSR